MRNGVLTSIENVLSVNAICGFQLGVWVSKLKDADYDNIKDKVVK